MRDTPVPMLDAAHPLGGPGESIALYAGPIQVNGRSAPGHVELQLRPSPNVIWSVEQDWHDNGVDAVDLAIPNALGPIETTAGRRHPNEGWLHSLDVGAADSSIQRVVTGWLNIPTIRGPHVIQRGGRTYAGRWSADIDGWTVTFDERDDHKEIWSRLKVDGTFGVTHVGEIRRTDGSDFCPSEVHPVLDALHLGMSFAIGRWVSPTVPVGFGPDGRRVWEQWGARQCTAGAPGALTWWSRQRDWELEELLRLVVRRYVEPEQRFSTRFLLSSAVLSAAGGFLEQRVMTATAALEHLMWTRLKIEAGISKAAFEGLEPSAGSRLVRLAAAASIPDHLDAEQVPALHAFAQTRSDDEQAAPFVLFGLRNKIVHPTGHEETLYELFPGLMTETWYLAWHHLVLLILHWLGYEGSHQRLLPPHGWAGDVQPVPWVSANGRG